MTLGVPELMIKARRSLAAARRREHHAALQRAFNDRNVADYDAPGVIGEVAEETLSAAAAFLDAADDLLRRP